MQEMQTSMAVSKNVLRSFRLTTEDSAQMQVRKMSSEIATPLLSLVCKHQRCDPIRPITSSALKETPLLNAQVNTSQARGLRSAHLSSSYKHQRPFRNARVNTRPERGLQKECNSMLGKEKTPLLDS